MSAPQPEPQSEPRPRWPYFGPLQKFLVGCGLAMWVGSALPWVIIRPFNLPPSALARAWTLWAGLMTLGGGIARWRLVTVISAIGGGGVAAYLAGWQLLRVLRDCGFDQMLRLHCVPGPGVVVTFAAGMVAMWLGWRLRPLIGGGGR